MVWRSGPPWRTRKTCVKTLKSQMMDRNAVIRNSGRSTGRISDRKVCQAPAPSTRMASYSSRGIAVSPAYSVRATNGIACQTMIRVMIAKVDRPVSNQLWLEKSPRPAALSTQLTTPNWVSNSHCQTTVAVSGGVAQASTSAIDTASRIPLWSRSSSSASSVASTIVSATKATTLGRISRYGRTRARRPGPVAVDPASGATSAGPLAGAVPAPASRSSLPMDTGLLRPPRTSYEEAIFWVMSPLASLAAWSTLALPDRILVIMSLSGLEPASTAAQVGSLGVISPLDDDFTMEPSSGSLPSTVWPRLAEAGMAPFSLASRVWYFSLSISLIQS